MNCLGIGKLGLGLRQLSFGLVERRLKRPWVDLEKELPLFDERAFLIALAQQVARNLRPDIRIDQSVECADPFAKNRNILLLTCTTSTSSRTPRLRSRYGSWAYRSNDQADDEEAKRSAYPKFVF